ncbi:MAG: 6-carboxytetrahydropterin synthase [Phycisphaerales bacterium]|nr:6-carboxytetrahydropterin synthase [Phycisphaerales bacterium]
MRAALERTVRFAAGARRGERGSNGFAGSPPLRGTERFFEIDVEVVGDVDRTSGYLLNIKAIDEAVLASALPVVRRASDPTGPGMTGGVLAELIQALRGRLPVEVRRVRLRLSPYHTLEMRSDTTDSLTLRLQFDFSASHRLHVPGWTEAENRECFGKCNHPNGHGHNYRLEPRVRFPASGAGISIDALERVVQDAVIERFDHKHLNLDTAEFADGSGLNPSVENIAMVCFRLLERPVAGLGSGVSLASVRVWETDRTSAEYPA